VSERADDWALALALALALAFGTISIALVSAGAEIEQHSWDHMCCTIPSSSSCTTRLVSAEVLRNGADEALEQRATCHTPSPTRGGKRGRCSYRSPAKARLPTLSAFNSVVLSVSFRVSRTAPLGLEMPRPSYEQHRAGKAVAAALGRRRGSLVE
jgi:hypothetical protein